MTPHPYDRLLLPDGGRLILTSCPGTKGAGLAESITQLRQTGADAVISMTPSDELARLGVADLPEVVANAGLRWFHLPIEDDAAPGPAFEQAWAVHRDTVMSLLSDHSGIVIHCRGGSGRTGFMAALILREIGMESTHADELVKGLRPQALSLAVHTDYLAAREAQWPRQRQAR